MRAKTFLLCVLACLGLVVVGCHSLPIPLPTSLPDPGDLPIPTFQPPITDESPTSAPPATDDGQPPEDNSLMLLYGLIVLFGFLALLQRTNKPPE